VHRIERKVVLWLNKQSAYAFLWCFAGHHHQEEEEEEEEDCPCFRALVTRYSGGILEELNSGRDISFGYHMLNIYPRKLLFSLVRHI
jgi:hypothetical protein